MYMEMAVTDRNYIIGEVRKSINLESPLWS
jgi:hypothetical protein